VQEAVEGMVESAHGAVVGIKNLFGDLAVETGGGLGHDLSVFRLAGGLEAAGLRGKGDGWVRGWMKETLCEGEWFFGLRVEMRCCVRRIAIV